jgi:branched-chain amino acid transport system ATP-binding protein
VICGLLPPRRGKVSFKGASLARLRTDQILRCGISFLPQDRSLFPDMTVKENIRMGGYILTDRHEVERRVEAVFETFPILRQRSGQPAKTLSGGEQQMLLLGRALVLRPELIMLDEPSLGLAPRISRQIFDSMERLRTAGMTVLLVEQNARMGLEFADWGCVLDLGKMVFEGPAAAILEDARIQEVYLGRRRARAGEHR